MVLLNAQGTIDPAFMSKNLQEAEEFFNSTNVTAAEAETLTNGSNADSLHTHFSTVTAGSAVGVSDDRNESSGGGTFHVDIPVGFSGATTFELMGNLSLALNPAGFGDAVTPITLSLNSDWDSRVVIRYLYAQR